MAARPGGHAGAHRARQACEQQYAEQQQPAYNPCANYSQWLISCLKTNENNIAGCQDYMNQLTQCERDNYTSLNQF